MLAAVLARVSTEKQSESVSLETQVQKMREYASKQDIIVPDEYIFTEMYSGLKETRPIFEAIETLCKDKKIQALIVYSSDRYTRNPISGTRYDAMLRKYKVELHYVSRGKVDIYSASGRLMNTIERSFSEYEANQIQERTQRAKRELAEQGIPLQQGYAPFGYQRIGTKRNARFVIIEDEAKIIIRIYEWYDSGILVADILKKLDGIPTIAVSRGYKKGSNKWQATAVYTILRNEVYAGTFYARKHMLEDGKKIPLAKDDRVPAAVPAIVDRDLWNRVQKRLDESNIYTERKHSKYEYLLARRMRCGICGKAMQGYAVTSDKLRLYYRCTSQSGKHHLVSCGLPQRRVTVIDDKIWNWLYHVANDSSTIDNNIKDRERFIATIKEQNMHRINGINEEIEEYQQMIQHLVSQLARAKGMFYETIERQANQYSTKIEELKKEKQTLQKSIPDQNIQDKLRILPEYQKLKPLLVSVGFETKRACIELLDLRFVFYQDKLSIFMEEYELDSISI